MGPPCRRLCYNITFVIDYPISSRGLLLYKPIRRRKKTHIVDHDPTTNLVVYIKAHSCTLSLPRLLKMLKSYSGWMIPLPSPPLFPVSSNNYNNSPSVNTCFPINGALRVLGSGRVPSTLYRARRRMRYNDEDE